MATRTIEDRKSRLITMLVNPLMSCSARLPIYLVMIGAFFPNCASFMLLCIYTAGILLAVIMARIFSKFLVKGEDSPFCDGTPPPIVCLPLKVSCAIHGKKEHNI